METWKDIPNYEGLYQASDTGLIRSAPGKTTFTKKHGVRHWHTRILKFKACKDFNAIGYRVTLWKDGKLKDFLVARLVATTFLENLIDTKMTVNHKDGNRLNNNIDNLEWLTLADNIRHGFETGLYKQIGVRLISVETGESKDFRSLVKASKEINRSSGYISDCIKLNKKAKDLEGNIYDVIKL